MFRGSKGDETALAASVDPLLPSKFFQKIAQSEARRLAAAGNSVVDEQAESAAAGYHGGQIHIWAVTPKNFVVLSNAPKGAQSKSLPLSAIRGIRCHRSSAGQSTGLLVRNSVAEPSLLRLSDVSTASAEHFARAVATRTDQTVDPYSLVFAKEGYLAFSEDHVRFPCAYLGGYPGLPDPGEKPTPVTMVMDDAGVHLLQEEYYCRLSIPWQDVRSLTIEGAEQTRRRVTATRMLAVGLLAFAIPKDEKHDHAYIAVGTDSGELILRAVMSPHEARAKLGPFLRRAPTAASVASEPTAEDTASALTRVAELNKQGLLTEEEFAAAKRQILGL